jgi:hypothetical protein
MGRYDRHYDYGLRGFDDTYRAGRGARLTGGPIRPSDYDFPYRRTFPGHYAAPEGYDFPYRAGRGLNTPHVVARYNLDYVFPREERPVNYNPYGGDPDVPVGDESEFQRPYVTTGGTRTYRGSRPVGWERAWTRYARDYWGY